MDMNEEWNSFFRDNKEAITKIALDLLPLIITLFGIAVTNRNISYFAEIWIRSNGLLWLGMVYFLGYFQNVKEILKIAQFKNQNVDKVLKMFPTAFFTILIAIYFTGLFGKVESMALKCTFNLLAYFLALGLYVLSFNQIQKQLQKVIL